MRFAWWVLVLAGCGRIGFASDGGADVGFFISPTGSDANPGTRDQPWLTFAGSLARLGAGDRLMVLDGVYDADGPSGPLLVDCRAAAVNGTPDAPIVVRADHPRRAHVISGRTALEVESCHDWEVDDLWLEGSDSPGAGGTTPLAQVSRSQGIVLHGLLLVHTNRYANNHVVEISHDQNVTVEDCEAYDFFREGYAIYDSSGTVFRRLYANGRDAQDIAGGYTSTCAGADLGVAAYYSRGGSIEDSIMERVCSGYTVTAGRNVSGDTGVGDSHHFVGDIAFDSTNHGFEVFTDCDGLAPCDSPDRIASDNTFENCAAIGVTSGYRLDGVQNTLDHVTSIGMATDTDIWLGVYSVAGGLAATSYVTAALCVAGGTGISSANQTDWSIASSNVWLATSSYVPNDAHIATSTTVDPQIGGCRIYLPPNSPMLGAGPNGTPIGADIRTLQDGRPYWRSDGTFAGCGAVVPGVNDDPATSCIGVHTRLNVGVNGCALPR